MSTQAYMALAATWLIVSSLLMSCIPTRSSNRSKS